MLKYFNFFFVCLLRAPSAKSSNIMYDRRIVRGSTHALKRQIQERMEKAKIDKKSPKRKQKRLHARKHEYSPERVKTPDPVPGRSHIEMQTDEYLEEIVVAPEEQDQNTQTDPFSDRNNI